MPTSCPGRTNSASMRSHVYRWRFSLKAAPQQQPTSVHRSAKHEQPAGLDGQQLPRSTMAPFPTGPLAVFGRDLAAKVFRDCAYVRSYERHARRAGRKTLCRGPRKHLSFASTLCDSVIAHWLAMCDTEATIAHTTRTKSHHYMWRGAWIGWMARTLRVYPAPDPEPDHSTRCGAWLDGALKHLARHPPPQGGSTLALGAKQHDRGRVGTRACGRQPSPSLSPLPSP